MFQVELFVSYYNYYTPESFAESTGSYTAKKSSVNDEIDALRHRCTRALFTRSDVVVVASVSCIYGLGLPADYLDAASRLTVRSARDREAAWRRESGGSESGGETGDASAEDGGNDGSEQSLSGDGGAAEPLRRSLNDVRTLLDRMLYSVPENGVDLVRGTYTVSYHDMSMKVWGTRSDQCRRDRRRHRHPPNPLILLGLAAVRDLSVRAAFRRRGGPVSDHHIRPLSWRSGGCRRVR